MTTIHGDITHITKGVIMHQVNCQNVMGAGVAKALYTVYPIVKQAYHAYCNRTPNAHERLGYCQALRIKDDLYIVNSFGQFEFGRKNICYTNMDLLKLNLTKASQFAQELGLPLYVPARIGCGLAGGNWSVLKPFIDRLENVIIVDNQ